MRRLRYVKAKLQHVLSNDVIGLCCIVSSALFSLLLTELNCIHVRAVFSFSRVFTSYF